MIASLNGKLILKELSFAVVECGGVGFKCFITQNTYSNLGQIGDNVFLHTYLAVREDAMDLYGFWSIDELECFKLITSVSGVGSKIGIAMLSEFTADKISLYIASGDAKSLTAASGVGIKLAQRIVLELKDKISKELSSAGVKIESSAASAPGVAEEAINALMVLGYSALEAKGAVSAVKSDCVTVEEIIKKALVISM